MVQVLSHALLRTPLANEGTERLKLLHQHLERDIEERDFILSI